jgi:hypothetical protein
MTSNSADWLDWQQEHTQALSALQEAQHAYHRAIAGSAFAADGLEAVDAQKEALRVLEAARIHLDEVRSRQPK